LHIGFVIGIIVLRQFYSIESTTVIPVSLNIGYESTVLSSRDGAIVRENRVNTEGQRYLVEREKPIKLFWAAGKKHAAMNFFLE
jgi:hypothetical protein